ncbi:MAG: hypothetical protein LUH04_15490, partial [Clostridium sp.]|nr:hypothetical protein [Clostridium sp.]
MRKKFLASALSLAILGSTLSAAGCGAGGRTAQEEQTEAEEAWATKAGSTAVQSEETDSGGETAGTEAAGSSLPGGVANEGNTTKMNLDFRPGFTVSADAYTPLSINANAPQYTLNADLSNIENLDQFSNLTQTQRNLIAKNGFVVTPTDSEQLF